jgi:hypothetical protein
MINFPLSPSLNQEYSFSGKTWKWNGSAWEINSIVPPIGFTGSQGTTGFTGSQGTTGFTGSQGVGFTGSQGVTGFTGSSGGATLGGLTGQSLVKASDADNDAVWLYNTVRSTAVSGSITNADDIILATGTITLTLPSAIGITGKTITIKNTSTGQITVNCFSAQTIDSYTNLILGEINTALVVASTGSSWAIV